MDPQQIVSCVAGVDEAGLITHQEVPLTPAVQIAIAAALTPPPLPPITVNRPDPAKPAGAQYGVWVAPPMKAADRVYPDVAYEGFGNGAAVQKVMGRSLWANARIVDSFGPGDTSGQGVYADDCGPHVINGSLLGWNGLPRNRPDVYPSLLRHNFYGNRNCGAITANDSLILRAAATGIQNRNPAQRNVYNNSVFIDNGIGVLNVMGYATTNDCLFLGGHYQWSGSAWNANSAVMNYWPVTLNDTRFVGLVGQGDAPMLKPTAPRFPAGCIVSGGTWKHTTIPFIKPPAGPLVTAKNCEIHGWPGEAFAGASPHDGSGFVVKPKPIAYDWLPIVNAYLANKLTGKQAVARIKADVATLIAAAA